jgi:hypothetical protein
LPDNARRHINEGAAWPYRTEEERNEIREALRKHGPSSKDYNNLKVILLLT